MNATIFGRIFWKEYRAQRAFWISMAVLTIGMDLFLLAYWLLFHPDAMTDPVHHEPIHVLFAVGLSLAAFYALGSGATLFATERETETYDFLRGLPVKPLAVFAGKVAFALSSTAALFLLAWSVALALAQKLPDPLTHREIWALLGPAGIELLAWGIFFSLVLKRPLLAVVCAVTTVSIVMGIVGRESNRWMVVDLGSQTAYIRLLIVALLTVVDIALASRWFHERLLSPSQPRGPRGPGLSEDQIETAFNRVLPAVLQSGWAGEFAGGTFDHPRPSSSAMLGRLLWQESRQSAAMSAALIAMPLFLALLAWAEWMLPFHSHYVNEVNEYWFDAILFVTMLSAGLSVPLLGSSVFLADQTGCRFRFLAERGIPPRLVWLSRQIRGLSVMLLGMLLALILWLPVAILLAGRNDHGPLVVIAADCAGYVVVAYACGQLCSMVFRSGILAATFGVFLTGLLCGWAAFMHWLGMSWLWTVAPLLLAFMAATWLHAPNWLVERETRWARLRPVLVIAVPAVMIFIAIPLVRIYEIPLVGPGFDVAELTRPVTAEEKETLAIYQRAIELVSQAMPKQSESGGPEAAPRSAADEAARRKAEEQAVALALEASRRPLLESFPEPGSVPDLSTEIGLADLVLANGKRLQSEGKLDAALDRYLAAERIALDVIRQHAHARIWAGALERRVCEHLTDWAACRGQSSQKVLDGLRSMEELWQIPLSYIDDIKYDYLWDPRFRFLEGERDALKSPRHSGDNTNFAFMRWFPWERARASRMLDLLTAEEVARYREIERELASGPRYKFQTFPFRTAREFANDITFQIVAPLLGPISERGVGNGRVIIERDNLEDCLKIETRRRATQLILALEAWRLDHGELPKSLEDIGGNPYTFRGRPRTTTGENGEYLDRPPVDPYSGNPFRYEPKGLGQYLVWWTPDSSNAKTLAPGRPFIACDSSSTPPHEAGDGGGTSLRKMPERNADDGPLRSEVWERVWVFPIP